LRTILLVDDEPNMRSALRRSLHGEGYQILTASSAEEAVRVVESKTIDLVVCDQMMPGQTGTEFLAWLAERQPAITRILLTGCPTAETALDAINQGKIYHFFTKPCDPLDLAVTIRHAMEQKSMVENTRRLLDEMEAAFRNGLDLLQAARLLLAGSEEAHRPAELFRSPDRPRDREVEEGEKVAVTGEDQR
jgi:DNA-binding NtrC family response regulator